MDQTNNTSPNINPTILLIEDEFYIRDIYEGILTHAGYNVLTATDGGEGLQQAMKKPKLILLDIMLPTTNGLEVLKKLKSNPDTQNIPVVLITNLGQQEVIKEAFDNGAQGYLLKVRLEPKLLLDLVEKYLADPNFKMDVNSLTFD